MGSKKRCGAKTKGGKKCRAYAMSNGRCRIHGGATPRGAESPHYVHGRRSKYRLRDGDLAERFLACMADATLVGLREELAWIDTRIQDATTRLADNRWDAEHINAIKAQADLVERLATQGKQTATNDAVRNLIALTRQGGDEARLNREILELIDHRRKVAVAEHRRAMDEEKVVRSDQVVMFFREAYTVIQHAHDEYYQDDKEVLYACEARILSGLDNLIGQIRSS